ncbi:HAD-IIIC family phosphatase [Natronospora cellulosivora (SeqCode)]
MMGNKKGFVEKLDSTIQITVITNITLKLYFIPYLSKNFKEKEIITNVSYISFHNYLEKMNTITESNIIIIWLNFEVMFPDVLNRTIRMEKNNKQIIDNIVEYIKSFYETIHKLSKAKIIWISFEDYYDKTNLLTGNILQNTIVDTINLELVKITRNQSTPTTSLIDFKKIIANIGIQNALNYKNKYRWNCPYTKILFKHVANEIFRQYLIIKRETPKCIILDCDNVLWGGILSEEGIENIKLSNVGIGRVYQDFQRYLLKLYNLGIILTLCSKNDVDDVLYVFRNHSQMILREKHISCYQVNWNNKANNIINISKMLNIGLDSMIFLDDSKYEIETVKELLPNVKAMLFDIKQFQSYLSMFNLDINLSKKNISLRHKTYKTNIQRKQLKDETISNDHYLKLLKTKVIISEAIDAEINRISELSQRTNKCTNGKRYDILELKKKFISSKYNLFSVYVSDKFGDLGLVGALGIIVTDNCTKLDLFCLSCRALGRKVEKKMIDYVTNTFKLNDYYFITTNKNNKIKDLLGEIKY